MVRLPYSLPILGALLLAAPLHAQSLCSFRNGSGVNPAGYACVNDPVIGQDWHTTVDIATSGAQASAVAVFEGGPLPGIPIGNRGELLCNFPEYLIDVAAGSHTIPVPNLPSIVGMTFCTQAAAIYYGPTSFQLFNALDITMAAPGAEDITVHVFGDDGNDATPLIQVPGASVTLWGKDPASWNGVTLPADASGQAVFPGVAGPYTVTAQYDFVGGGLTTRLAASLVEIEPVVAGTPPAGSISVLMRTDLDFTPNADATLSGTVTNLPTLVGNEFVKVMAVANGAPDFEMSIIVDPVTGAYSLPVPSNVLLDCHVVHGADFTQPTSGILASLLAPGIGSTGPGTTLIQNFDFGSSAVIPWTTPVSFSVTPLHPALDLSVQLLVEDVTAGTEYDFSFFDGSPPPTTIHLPDVTHPSFAGYRVSLDADTFDPGGNLTIEQAAEVVLTTTPASISLDLPSPSTIQQPLHQSTVTLAQLANLTVQTVEGGTGGYGTNGFNLFLLGTEAGGGGTPPPGIDQAMWAIFTAPGVETFDLPHGPLPLFAAGQTVFGGQELQRFTGATFDFHTVFDGNLPSTLPAFLASLTGMGYSSNWIYFFLVP